MKIVFAFILAIFAVIPSQAAPFNLVSSGKAARIVVAKGEPENVVLAAKDLASDVNKITGVEPQVVIGHRTKAGDIYIKTVSDTSRWEAYDVALNDGILCFNGSDDRGTMFGIYDFIENFLKVDPLYFWNDTAYPSAEELVFDDVCIHQASPNVKFRGWFINDEDLLTSWRDPSGNRRLDYPYYSTVVNHEVIEKMAEALVRSRYNLIIPASFLNISNPPERAIVDICARRGVFISMHHIEPMGVDGYTFMNYWKDRGQDVVFSYFSNSDKMEEVWRETARIWAQYPRVIWQVGLRGIADRPTWDADPNVPKTDEGRGKLISDAIAKQVSILDELGVPKENRYISSTLWMEGAQLNRQGFLTFPKGTIVVFADNGPGWKWTPDFWTVKRDPQNEYGVYYHHQLIGDGPHLAPLIPASVTYRMMKDAVSNGTSDYAIFNVSNIREFVYNIDATGKMLWNMDSYDPEKWTDNWIERHYLSSRDAWKRAYVLYYNSLQIHPAVKLPMYLDGYMQSICRSEMSAIEKALAGEGDAGVLNEPFTFDYGEFEKSDDFIKSIFLLEEEAAKDKTREAKLTSEAQIYATLCAQKASFELTKTLAEALYADIPESEKPFAYTTIVYPSTLMYHYTAFTADILLSRQKLAAGDKAGAKETLKNAINEMDKISEAAGKYCSGKWENWYRDCRKINLKSLQERAVKICNGM